MGGTNDEASDSRNDYMRSDVWGDGWDYRSYFSGTVNEIYSARHDQLRILEMKKRNVSESESSTSSSSSDSSRSSLSSDSSSSSSNSSSDSSSNGSSIDLD